MEQYPIKIKILCEGSVERLDRYVERQMFSIAKEAMTNACKHSNAEHVIVEIAFIKDLCKLLISDDGIGLKHVHTDYKNHFGLLGMKERANQINANFSIESNNTDGVKVELIVSIKSKQQD